MTLTQDLLESKDQHFLCNANVNMGVVKGKTSVFNPTQENFFVTLTRFSSFVVDLNNQAIS